MSAVDKIWCAAYSAAILPTPDDSYRRIGFGRADVIAQVGTDPVPYILYVRR